MKHTIIYMISLLLAMAGAFRANGQELRNKPAYPNMPYYVEIEAPEGVTCTLEGVGRGDFAEKGQAITVTVNSGGKKLRAGYPKWYETGENGLEGDGTSLDGSGSNYSFTMPDYPVTVVVVLASSEAELTGLTYQVNASGSTVQVNPLPEADGDPADIELPWNTSSKATISFTPTASEGATVGANDISLSSGQGTATITVTAEDGTTTKKYMLNFTTQKELKGNMVTLSRLDLVYTGQDLRDEVRKALKVEDKETVLNENEHYTLSWSKTQSLVVPMDVFDEVKDAGNYTVTVIPTNQKGGYGGDNIEKDFSIKPRLLSEVTVEPISDQSYEIGGVKPEPVVTYNGMTLKKDQDYRLSYKNNGAVTDKAEVIVTAKESSNYTGQIEATFNIIPKQVRVDSEGSYNADQHNENIALTIATGKTFTVDAEGATLYSLTMEDGAQLDLQKGLKIANGFNASYSVGKVWKTFYNPIEGATVSADNCWWATGYGDEENQGWTDADSYTEQKTNIVAGRLTEQSVTISQEGKVDLTAITEIPTSSGNTLNTGTFLFEGNPTLKEIQVQNVYVLNEAGTRFELQEEAKIKPFQAYLVASEATQALFKSLPLGGGNTPTGLQELLTGSFRAWGSHGRLMLESREPADVVIYSLSGQLVRRLDGFSGNEQVELPQGIYFVHNGQMAVKVIL